MLKKLIIKNFAIILDAEVNFKEGMTVLTGETGAGKSLIIDSISILLGNRAESVYIRNSAEFAYLQAFFDISKQGINDILSKYNLPFNRDTLTIERTIFHQNSKNNIKINGVNVSLQILKIISFYLADIHIQNDTVKLLNSDYYLELIDRYDYEAINVLSNEYQMNLFKYQAELKKFRETTKKNDLVAKDLDVLKFQRDELKDSNLKEGELLELEKVINGMKNFDRLFNHYQEAISLLDNEYFSFKNIYEAYKEMKKASEINDELSAYAESLEASYYNLEDCLKSLKHDSENLEYDPKVLEEALARQAELERLEKKYRRTIGELIKYLEEIEESILRFENFDAYTEELKNNVEKRYLETKKSALNLSEKRKKIAAELEKKLKEECFSLDLSHASFKITFQEVAYKDAFDETIFYESGIDSLDIFLLLNAGEGFKPLNKSASGGEASRIMMAFKAVFIKKFKYSLVVFDEIDQGVSGFQALKMAEKMQELAEFTDILTISHLPQVAAMADNQINIYKYEENGRTFSNFSYLDSEERILEIAKMISGEKVTGVAISNAKEMLNWRKLSEN